MPDDCFYVELAGGSGLLGKVAFADVDGGANIDLLRNIVQWYNCSLSGINLGKEGACSLQIGQTVVGRIRSVHVEKKTFRISLKVCSFSHFRMSVFFLSFSNVLLKRCHSHRQFHVVSSQAFMCFVLFPANRLCSERTLANEILLSACFLSFAAAQIFCRRNLCVRAVIKGEATDAWLVLLSSVNILLPCSHDIVGICLQVLALLRLFPRLLMICCLLHLMENSGVACVRITTLMMLR